MTLAGERWLGQTFTPEKGHRLSFVILMVLRAGSPGTVNVGIYATASELPTGTALTTGSFDGNGVTTSAGGEWIAINLTDYVVLSSVKYAIVINAPASDDNNKIGWKINTAGTYTGGNACKKNPDTGNVWVAVAGDFAFEEWGVEGGNEGTGVIAVVGTTFRYVDAYGDERWLEGALCV